MGELVQRAVNAIIRPPRSEYNLDEVPLDLNANDNRKYLRHPIVFQNERNQKIVGSIYHEASFSPLLGGPCIMYLHGNASSQLEGQFLVPNFCPRGCFVFCFDFVGCGNSDGDYVSLGYYETQDTNFLIKMLHIQFNMGPFVLWGRSMGAATTLLVNNPYVVAKISDSSFTSVYDMCAAIAASMSLPSMFIPAVVWFLKKKVLSVADFDFDDISPLKCEQDFPVPCLFGHAAKDQFIPFVQCKALHENYDNPRKQLMVLEGGHNSKRDINWIRAGVKFALEQICIDTSNLVVSECRELQGNSFHFGSFENMMKQARQDDHTATNSEMAEFQASSTEQPPKKEHKHHHTPEEKEERKRAIAEKHRQNEIKRAKKRAKREKAEKMHVDSETNSSNRIEAEPHSS